MGSEIKEACSDLSAQFTAGVIDTNETVEGIQSTKEELKGSAGR